MKLFKNKVGRPSNETIEKRRKIYVIIIFVLVALIGAGVFYTVKFFKANNKVGSYDKNLRVGYSVTIKFDSNGAKSIGATTKSCQLNSNKTRCAITMPSITAKNGFVTLGWNTRRYATDIQYFANSTIYVNAQQNNTTYYAITKAKNPTIAHFSKTANVKSIGATKLSCYRYNGSDYCYVTAPSITAKSGYSVIGWKRWHMPNYPIRTPGHSMAIADESWYDATVQYNAKTYSATFEIIKGSGVDYVKRYDGSYLYSRVYQNSINPFTISCKTTPSSPNQCTINVPKIFAKSGWKVVGWSTSKYSSTYDIRSGSTLKLTSNNNGKKYYAIVKK